MQALLMISLSVHISSQLIYTRKYEPCRFNLNTHTINQLCLKNRFSYAIINDTLRIEFDGFFFHKNYH